MALRIKTFTYTADGVGGTDIDIDTDLTSGSVFLSLWSDAAYEAVFKTDAMPTDECFSFSSNTGAITDAITAFTATGFTLGTNNSSNANGVDYYGLVIQDDSSAYLSTGSYEGVADSTLDINSTTFLPNWVMVKRDGASVASVYTSLSPTGQNDTFDSGSYDGGGIQVLLSNGFRVGSNSTVNSDGDTYYYVALKTLNRYIQIASYISTGIDDLAVSVGNIDPTLTWVSKDVVSQANVLLEDGNNVLLEDGNNLLLEGGSGGGGDSFVKSNDMSGELSVAFGASASLTTNGIQELGVSQIILGDDSDVNSGDGVRYNVFSVADVTYYIPLPSDPHPVTRAQGSNSTEKKYSMKIYDKTGSVYKGVVTIVGGLSFQKRVNAGLGYLQLQIPQDSIEVDFLDEIQIWVQDRDTPGLQIYSGYIDEVSDRLSLDESSKVVNGVGYCARLAYTLDWDGSSLSQVRNSVDPSNAIEDVIDYYQSNESDTRITYTGDSIDSTGLTISYTSNNKMCLETISRMKELSGSNWYFYIGVDNVLQFHEYPTSSTHKFVLGKDIGQIVKRKSSLPIVNNLIFWNGITDNTDPSYLQNIYYSPSSVSAYWGRYSLLTDGRVSNSTTADNLGAAYVEANKNPNVSLEFSVNDNNYGDGYDIESINPGDTCVILNVEDSDINEVVFRITGVDYSPSSARVYVEDSRDLTSRKLEDIRRSLNTQTYSNNPGDVTLVDVD